MVRAQSTEGHGGLEQGTDTASLVLVSLGHFRGQTAGERSQSEDRPLGPGEANLCAHSLPPSVALLMGLQGGWTSLRASVKGAACVGLQKEGLLSRKVLTDHVILQPHCADETTEA